jgi:hypothetical protein
MDRNFRFYFLIPLVTLVCAVPFRFTYRVGPFQSVSLLDGVLALCLGWLFLRAVATRRLFLGSRPVFVCLSLPVGASILSLAWTVSDGETVKTILLYGYALLFYLVTVSLFRGCSGESVMRFFAGLVLLSLLASLFMYLRVPGFEIYFPTEGFTPSEITDTLVSIYTRLSHPFIGRSNDFAAILGFPILPLVSWGVLRGKRAYLLAGLVAFAAMALTFSRGALVAFFLAMALWAYPVRSEPRIRRLGLAFLAILAVSLAGTRLVHLGEVGGRQLAGEAILRSRLNVVNMDRRIDAQKDYLDLLDRHPWTGIGAGVLWNTGDPLAVGSAHNYFLQQTVYYGWILGTGMNLSLLALPFFFFRRPSRSSRPVLVQNAIGCSILFLLIDSFMETTMEASVPRVLIHYMLGLSVLLLRSLEAPRPDAREAGDAAPSAPPDAPLGAVQGYPAHA